jgi:hypothetical protein
MSRQLGTPQSIQQCLAISSVRGQQHQQASIKPGIAGLFFELGLDLFDFFVVLVRSLSQDHQTLPTFPT